MILPRTVRTSLIAALAGAGLTVATLGAATPAGAVTTPGWRPFFTTSCNCGYFAVAADGARDGWAVGVRNASSPTSGTPIAARWHNGAWRAARLPHGLTGLLGAVSADSANDAWAVGTLGGYVLHWNGAVWSVAKKWRESGLPRELTGVTALSPADVWVFGGPGAWPGLGTWHFNGRSWARVSTGPGQGIVSASALSQRNIWAIGSVNSPQDSLVHYTGSWRRVTAPALSGLQFSSIQALATGNVWAAATVQTRSFTPVLVHLSGGRWSRVRLPWSVVPSRIAPDGRGGIWLTAQNALGSWAIHRTAAGRWSRVRFGLHAGVIGLARIPGTTSLWGAGAKATASGGAGVVWAYGRVR